MYHIYQTEGIILSGSNSGEANRIIWIFTKDLGLVSVSAQGVRLLKSKLRYNLQDFSRSNLSLVKGKNGWRITNSEEIENYFHIFESDKDKSNVVANTLALIKRLITGEEKNEKLYNLISKSFEFLKDLGPIEEKIKNFECLLVLRIIKDLGYLAINNKLENFSKDEDLSEKIIDNVGRFRREMISEINNSLKHSSL